MDLDPKNLTERRPLSAAELVATIQNQAVLQWPEIIKEKQIKNEK